MPTIDEVKDYLGIDYNDDVSNRNIKKYMSVADSWLKGAIGENYPRNDERAKQLALFVIEDLYDRGSYSVKENSNIEKMKNDFVLQLQCEGRE
jgi:hypothetical protein